MEVKDVEGRVAAIREVAADWEAAHSWEDQLWLDVLRAIADGAPNPKELARAAVATASIPFARYCA
jgi:hypothetical protein